MAEEPLAALFSQIRRPRPYRRAQWTPAPGLGGDSPGLRGTINPLDSQAMADTAQGVDIGSIDPPTRLAADRMGEEVYAEATPVGRGEEGGGEKSPFMFASTQGGTPAQTVQYRTECGPNGCRRVPISEPMGQAMPMAQALPPGVTLGPGETFVPGSLREGGSSMVASAAPAAASMTPQFNDPQSFFDAARQASDQAKPFATGVEVQAIPANMYSRDAAQYAQIGVTAAVIQEQANMRQLQKEIAVMTNALANRGLDQKSKALELEDKKLRMESGEYREEMNDAIRADREKPVQARAYTIVMNYLDDRAVSQLPPLPKEQIDSMVKMESGIINALDLSHYMGAWLQATDAIQAASASGADPAPAQSRAYLLLGKMQQMVYDRYASEGDAQKRASMIRGELTDVYANAYRKHLSSGGKEPPEDVVRARTIEAVDTHIADLEEAIESGSTDFFSPYFNRMKQQADAPGPFRQMSQQRAAEEQQESTPALGSSGTTPDGGVYLSPFKTFNLTQ